MFFPSHFSSKKLIRPKKKSLNKNLTTNLAINEHAYIGPKGYTISKEYLKSSPQLNEELHFLYQDLICKPELNTMMTGGSNNSLGFPVYRENNNKIYIPRFYGIERYGFPVKSMFRSTKNDLREDLIFSAPLFEFQEKIVEIYMKHVEKKVHEDEGGGGILEVPCGKGKTVMALKILSLLRKKTIILVHKEFLMDQWIERIETFLPGALIGRIQGKDYDIEGKDIVMGMIQTIYDKDHYDFSSFGLTIIDEVHHLGSEQFSRCLLKVITPYMLGISATVERKDKLSTLLFMFIGPKIYSETRMSETGEEKEISNVEVRCILYKHSEAEFNESLFDFRGNPQFSRMISKLCDFQPRTNFIVKVLLDLIEEAPDSQMIVLSQNLRLLDFIMDEIKATELCGFYIGGMKKIALEDAAKKKIILATYAMAAEGLDIKTLTTLVMITPRTDIVQSVGRILRIKHEKPIIVDIVDSHDMFQNQWKKRKAFYKQCNYKISMKNSTDYRDMITWNKK
jgi:superfamily II DNA or RNA helicase